MNKIIIDTREYVQELKKLVEEGKEVGMRIAGNSMAPFLVHERDYIFFQKPDRELKKGDMVFYERRNGQFVMHRIYKATERGFMIVGDAQTEIEPFIQPEQIFARITKVNRKGKELTEKDFCWKFFQYVWIRMVPVRIFLMKTYGRLKKKKTA